MAMTEKQISELKSHNIGYCLRRLRWNKCLTQQKFAELLGCNQSSVSMWERGVFLPREQTLEKIAKLYELPHDFFTK